MNYKHSEIKSIITSFFFNIIHPYTTKGRTDGRTDVRRDGSGRWRTEKHDVDECAPTGQRMVTLDASYNLGSHQRWNGEWSERGINSILHLITHSFSSPPVSVLYYNFMPSHFFLSLCLQKERRHKKGTCEESSGSDLPRGWSVPKASVCPGWTVDKNWK